MRQTQWFLCWREKNKKMVRPHIVRAALPDERKALGGWLCGNHTRGLPVDAFNRNFEACLAAQLGEEFSEAQIGKSRLEKIGVALLRSMCKLIHDGWDARAKGDGKEFRQCLDATHPGLHDAVSVGRAELSKRQDWSLEAAESLYQLVLPLLMHLVKTLRLDPNACATGLCPAAPGAAARGSLLVRV
jgi:hypothetical protein